MNLNTRGDETREMRPASGFGEAPDAGSYLMRAARTAGTNHVLHRIFVPQMVPLAFMASGAGMGLLLASIGAATSLHTKERTVLESIAAADKNQTDLAQKCMAASNIAVILQTCFKKLASFAGRVERAAAQGADAVRKVLPTAVPEIKLDSGIRLELQQLLSNGLETYKVDNDWLTRQAGPKQEAEALYRCVPLAFCLGGGLDGCFVHDAHIFAPLLAVLALAWCIMSNSYTHAAARPCACQAPTWLATCPCSTAPGRPSRSGPLPQGRLSPPSKGSLVLLIRLCWPCHRL